MTDYRNVLERDLARVGPAPFGLDDVARRRDRKRRNQRIAAGVVGIAVFVAAVWIVTSGGSLDRTQPAATGPAETGPAETGPAETGPVGRPAPPLVHASAAPDGTVRTGTCSDDARWRLELTDMGVAGPIVVRFELHRSPVGHTWRITIRDSVPGFVPPRLVFQGVRVAGDSGDLAVQRRTQDLVGADRFQAKAEDAQTGQVCMAFAQV